MLPQRATLLVLPLLLAFSGCPRRPVDFGVDGAPTSAAALLQRVAWAEAQVVTLKGEARLSVDSPQGKGAATLFVAVAHPARLHLEQLDFFGRPQGVLVTDGETVSLYLAQEGTAYRGPATPANLGRFLPLVMPPAELAAVLLGRAPRIAAAAPELRFDERLGRFVLTLARGEARQVLEVQPPSYRVVKSTAAGLGAYDLEFADVAPFGAATFPRRAALSAPAAKTSLTLTWKDVTLNEAPDPALFSLEPPEGVPVVEVDANGVPREAPAAR